MRKFYLALFALVTILNLYALWLNTIKTDEIKPEVIKISPKSLKIKTLTKEEDIKILLYYLKDISDMKVAYTENNEFATKTIYEHTISSENLSSIRLIPNGNKMEIIFDIEE